MTALAGCSGLAESGASSSRYPTIRRSIGETYETASDVAVTVRNPRLRKAVVVDQHTSPVQMAADLQFVVVDVAVDGEVAPETSEIRQFPNRFGTLLDGSPSRGSSAPLRSSFHPSVAGRPVGIPVPVASVQTAAVAWIRGLPKSVVWSLPDGVTASLDTAPSFRVETVEVSDETDPELTLTVHNVGGRDGRFYANVSGSQVQDGNVVVGFAVPAGEAVTHRERPGITAPGGEETRVVVDWGADEAALVVTP
jgi:hypothetical protein